MLTHWVESIVAVLLLIGGVTTWAFGIQRRLEVLETSYREHVSIKNEALREISGHMVRIEEKIDRMNTRCLSYASEVHRLREHGNE